jgi:anti-sigma B factor antagonist
MTACDALARRPFDVTVDGHGPEAVVVHARGELDLLTTPAFEDRLAAVLAGAPRRLVIDLSRLTFISARGVDALARLHASQAAGPDQRVLRLAAVPPTVYRTLRLAGVGQLFSVTTPSATRWPTRAPRRTGGSSGSPAGTSAMASTTFRPRPGE